MKALIFSQDRLFGSCEMLPRVCVYTCVVEFGNRHINFLKWLCFFGVSIQLIVILCVEGQSFTVLFEEMGCL